MFSHHEEFKFPSGTQNILWMSEVALIAHSQIPVNCNMMGFDCTPTSQKICMFEQITVMGLYPGIIDSDCSTTLVFRVCREIHTIPRYLFNREH